MISSAKTRAILSPFVARALTVQTADWSYLAFTLTARSTAPACRTLEQFLALDDGASALAPQTAAAPLIYVVDDVPEVTELYTTLLETAGYTVRAFNDRAEALAVLKTDKRQPDLLITDYRGISMSVDQFLHACRAAHPNLPILMASGFNRRDMRLSRVGPDRFIRKPFTPEELQQEVRAALAAK